MMMMMITFFTQNMNIILTGKDLKTNSILWEITHSVQHVLKKCSQYSCCL